MPGVQGEDKGCPRDQPCEKELAFLRYFQASHSGGCVQCVTPFTCEIRKSDCSCSVCPQMGLMVRFFTCEIAYYSYFKFSPVTSYSRQELQR